MRKPVLILLTIFTLGGTATLLSACNTTEGAGRDISAAGQGVSNAAQETKEEM